MPTSPCCPKNSKRWPASAGRAEPPSQTAFRREPPRPAAGRPAHLRLLLAASLLLTAARPLIAAPTLPNIDTNNVVVVTNAAYGAVGDGVTTNTAAIQAAINAAAAGSLTNGAAGGTVRIPAGIYLSGPLALKSAVNLQLDAGAILRMLPMGQYPDSGSGNGSSLNLLGATNVSDVEISGPGAIDGQGAPWWNAIETNSAFLRPIMIRLQNCSRQLIQNITLSNSPMFHISVSGNLGNVTVQNVTIQAPSSSANPPSHNTDACDVSGTNVLVQNCNISVGDDDFTCGGNTSGVLLTNNTYGNGHGVSIGSYTDGGVSNITVINCTFNGTANGIRIKSDNDRGGLVQNISYLNIGMTNVDFPIQVYGYYNEIGTPSGVSPYYAATQTVAAVTGTTPFYRNIVFSNLTATSVSGYPIGIIWARTEAPATNIIFDKVNLTGNRNFCLYNVTGAQFIDCNFNVSATSNTFVLFNAQPVVTNSTASSQWLTFAGLTTNGYGNAFTLDNAEGSLKDTNALGNGPLSLTASTFSVSNNLNLSSTILNYTLGASAATLAVAGSLTLGGTNNIYAGPGFTNGVYTLMTYTGSLTGALPALGAAPTNYSCVFNTNTAGQVTLTASYTGPQVPAAPTNLMAVATNAQVLLSWYASSTATNYNVKRSLVSGGSYAYFAVTAATNYTDNLVTNGTTYYYVVSGVNAVGEGTNSTQASATLQSGTSQVVATNVFSDNFSASTLNTTPAAPNGVSTSYEVISSKAWSPTPNLAAGHLKFGIGATTSGSVEVQALFTGSPVTLTSVGDSLALIVTFTNTSGLLTQTNTLSFGLYHSSSNYPVPGGLNGVATTSYTTNNSGDAQSWLGYFGQIAFTNAACQIQSRPLQTGTLSNNVQDVLTTGSGSSSFNSPVGTAIATASSASSLMLAAATVYTERLTITLASTGSLAITNQFYSGASTNGSLLSQFGGVASGTGYLTNTFDALAIGWRTTANLSATAMDINQISVVSSLTEWITNAATMTAPTITGPTNITVIESNNATFSASATGTPPPVCQWLDQNRNPIAGATNNTLTLTNVLYSQNGYGYFFVASNSVASVTNSATLTVVVPPPAAPANFNASPSNLLIVLNWNATAGATNYILKRGTLNGTYPTAFAGLTATNYADANVTNAVTYYYVLSAAGIGGVSTNSLSVSAAPLPSNQPTNLVAQLTVNGLSVSWPADHLGWRLQIQTNNLSNGLGTNWTTVANSTNESTANLPLNPANGGVFLRLVYP